MGALSTMGSSGGAGSGGTNPQAVTGALTDIFGSSTSGSTSTRVSQQGMNYLLQRLMEQGFADVRSTGRKAGVYDSITEELLSNDFLARAAGEVASRNTDVKTSSGSGGLLDQIFGINLGESGGILGAAGDAIKGIGDIFGF